MSVRQRLLFSFGTTAVRAAVSLLTGVIVARGLGPAEYGNLAYLLGSFWALRALLDLGSSSAFYTFIAQQRRSTTYYLTYFSWLALQFSVTALLIAIFLPDELIKQFWLGQSRHMILLALVATFLQNQVWQTVVHIHESYRLTVKIQVTGLIMISMHLVLMTALLARSLLSVDFVLYAIIAEYALAAIALSLHLRHRLAEDKAAPNTSTRQAISEFAVYCRPMVFVSLFSFAYEITDRWLLQRYGGPSQQGFYQVAMQLSTISLLATSSILNVLWKEIAEANAHQQDARVLALHRRATRILMFVAAVIGCFLAVWSEELVGTLLGNAYLSAWPVLFVMLFYPIHQAMGQLNGTLLMATGRTHIYMKLTVTGLLISIPISALMLLPPDSTIIGGLGLGALGLAIKTATLNALFTNLQAFVIAREYGDRHQWFHQVTGLLTLLVLGYTSRLIGTTTFGTESSARTISSALIGAIFYAVSAGIVAMRTPRLFGLDPMDPSTLISWIKQVTRRVTHPGQQ